MGPVRPVAGLRKRIRPTFTMRECAHYGRFGTIGGKGSAGPGGSEQLPGEVLLPVLLCVG